MGLYDFDSLFVFEMANNHQGDLEHAKRIIRAIGDLARKHQVKAGLKFQFRQLESFIHPTYRSRTDLPHIPRFMNTRLTKEEFGAAIDHTVEEGLIPMATPFDEESVDIMLELGVEVIKIGSCSAMDRPLLERVAAAGRPVIVSVGGLSMQQVDGLVGFLQERQVHFALNHCVAIYPTPDERLRLNQIAILKERFPKITIGYSTHEDPNQTIPIQIAFGMGARIFERHVGVQTEEYGLNAYSSTPGQLDRWIQAYKRAVSMCGVDSERPQAFPEETASLDSLKRGVWAARPLEKGARIGSSDVFFAMPMLEGQLTSDRWSDEGFVADQDYSVNDPIGEVSAPRAMDEEEHLVIDIVTELKGLLRAANIKLPPEASIELSHHFGLRRFREYGAIIIDVINRSYCKKLIVQLPKQTHPVHYHEKKEETFQLLYGDFEIEIDDDSHRLREGETALVKPKQRHQFQTCTGMVVEEISTHHENGDSFYGDEQLQLLPRDQRKTSIPNWVSTVATNRCA